MATHGQIRRLATARALATPSRDCLACDGSGLYDVVLATGEVQLALCRMTPNCARHADRVMDWCAQEALSVLVQFALNGE